MEAKLAIVVVVPDALTTVRYRVYACRDVASSFDQHHGVTAPAERAPGDAAQLRRVRGSGGLHIGVIDTAETMDAKGDSRVDVVEGGVAITLEN